MKRMLNSKDYWLEILRLADAQGRIQTPNQQSLVRYLTNKLSVSRPRVQSLLSKWEKEGKIQLEKNRTEKPIGLQFFPKKALPSSAEISKELERGVILIDWENLLQSMEPTISEGPSVSQIFLKLIKKISREIGEVISVFVFAPPHLASVWGETFHEKGFFIISCPKVTDKKGEEKDTVDEILIDFGGKVTQNMNLSYLCVGTGDRDFSKLYLEVIEKGLKTITVAASEKSLSSKLISLSDTIIILSTLEKGQE